MLMQLKNKNELKKQTGTGQLKMCVNTGQL